MQKVDADLHRNNDFTAMFRILLALRLVILLNLLQLISLYSGCFGSNSNNLICMVHYIKIIFNLYLAQKYYYNIRDYQAMHPVSNINFFLMVTFYYGMLFINLSELKNPSIQCVYLLGIYPLSDFIMVVLSLGCIKRAVDMKK